MKLPNKLNVYKVTFVGRIIARDANGVGIGSPRLAGPFQSVKVAAATQELAAAFAKSTLPKNQEIHVEGILEVVSDVVVLGPPFLAEVQVAKNRTAAANAADAHAAGVNLAEARAADGLPPQVSPNEFHATAGYPNQVDPNAHVAGIRPDEVRLDEERAIQGYPNQIGPDEFHATDAHVAAVRADEVHTAESDAAKTRSNQVIPGDYPLNQQQNLVGQEQNSVDQQQKFVGTNDLSAAKIHANENSTAGIEDDEVRTAESDAAKARRVAPEAAVVNQPFAEKKYVKPLP